MCRHENGLVGQLAKRRVEGAVQLPGQGSGEAGVDQVGSGSSAHDQTSPAEQDRRFTVGSDEVAQVLGCMPR